jgi:glycine/D-amino acid oxidase-like deaminating enzyme
LEVWRRIVKTIPFWTDQFPRPDNLPVSSLPPRVDVAIIGGGYTGLNAARVLVQSGAVVAVLEQHTIGWGASSRNAGIATAGFKQPIAAICDKFGHDLGRRIWQASLDAVDLIGEIVADEEIACDFVRQGHVTLAVKSTHFEAMADGVDWFQNELDYHLQLVSRNELRSEIGSDAYYGGVIEEWSAALHPAKYVFGLAVAVARHGVVLCEHTAVTRLEKQPQGFNVHTSQGTLVAREVLVATNGYTGWLMPNLRRGIFPTGSYVIVTEPLAPALQKQLNPRARTFYSANWFNHTMRLTPDGRLLFGGQLNLRADLHWLDSAERLRKQMVRVFPELRRIPMTHSWMGQLGQTFDLMPHIGRIDGVHYALGYNGHGLPMATYLGTEIGLLLSGQKRSSPFEDMPHPTRFYYRKRPWFLPLTAFYYRILDKLT